MESRACPEAAGAQALVASRDRVSIGMVGKAFDINGARMRVLRAPREPGLLPTGVCKRHAVRCIP